MTFGHGIAFVVRAVWDLGKLDANGWKIVLTGNSDLTTVLPVP
ncbi:hypothetical protein USDA257_c46460 [Sinorhizobium fredii USDA 257]|uniref:Uncharacterized protein n=1 Tax=Sinorhizobium fredii (strain USDA 257) TaxID=1185652 RepID=I3XBC7_SINF2|nr:hypothetical protein USDA257_c46460 [Sinorhizobium fredii USDA 257]